MQSRHYEISGKVVSVERASGKIVVAHHEIPGYMAAMTMPFKVKDAWVLDSAKPGDQLNATLTVGVETYLEGVSIVQTTADPQSPASVHEPVPGAQVPNFKFINQDGKHVAFAEFRNSPVLLTFIYTRCPLPDYCIRMSSNFGAIARDLRTAGLYGKVHLLSISIDPEFDKPDVLRQYGKHYVADVDPNFQNWQFLTADPKSTKNTAEWFGLIYLEENGQIVHSLRTALIGPDGKLVDLYRGNEWDPSQVTSTIKQMLKVQPERVGYSPNVKSRSASSCS